MPSSHTSQPRPQAPSVGDSQSSSTKRISCFFVSMPMARREVAVWKVPATISMSYGCSMTQPWRAQYRDSVKISSWKVTGVFMRDGLLVWPGLYPAPSPGTPRASDGTRPDRAVFHRWQLVALLCRWWLVTTFRRRFIPVVRWRLGSVIRRWQEQIEGTLAHRLGGIARIAFEQGQKFFRTLLEIARA